MTTIYNRHLMAKIEATNDTDAVPVVGTNDVRFLTAKISMTPEIIPVPSIKTTMGPEPHMISTKRFMQLDLEILLKPSGAAGTAPEYDPLIRACGLDQTIVASTSVAYDPLTTSQKKCSIYWYEDGLLYKMIGSVGKLTVDAQIGKIPILKFSMKAPFVEPTAVSVPSASSMVFQSALPIVFSSADVINDGGVINVGAFNFDDGNDVQHHYTTGQSVFRVANRVPKLKITKDSVSTAAEWIALTASTNVSFSATFGSTAGNRLVATAPVARRENVVNAVRADVPTHEISYGLYESVGDDAFKLLFN
jgi:hypothetical protein